MCAQICIETCPSCRTMTGCLIRCVYFNRTILWKRHEKEVWSATSATFDAPGERISDNVTWRRTLPKGVSMLLPGDDHSPEARCVHKGTQVCHIISKQSFRKQPQRHYANPADDKMVMLTFMYEISYGVISPRRANSMAEYAKGSVSSISHLCAQKSESINEAAMLVPFYVILGCRTRECSQSMAF